MSSTHEQALAQFEAAKKQLEDTRRLPEKDEFPIGTVLRWDGERGTGLRAAVKTSDYRRDGIGDWKMSSHPRELEYSYLLVNIRGASKLEVATSWSNAFVQNPPKIELTDKENEPRRFELTDTKTGQTWYRDGDTWVLYEDDLEQIET